MVVSRIEPSIARVNKRSPGRETATYLVARSALQDSKYLEEWRLSTTESAFVFKIQWKGAGLCSKIYFNT